MKKKLNIMKNYLKYNIIFKFLQLDSYKKDLETEFGKNNQTKIKQVEDLYILNKPKALDMVIKNVLNVKISQTET